MIENGVIKIKSVNGVLYGITLDDLRQTLGVSYDTHGEIVTLAPINKWAKYKYIKRPEFHFTSQLASDFTWKTVAQIEALGQIPWWKGTNGQCGLTFTTYPNIGSPSSGFLHDLLAGSLTWGYERPTGGIGTSPFRFRDMNYYWHASPKPVEGVFDNLRLVDNGNNTYNLTVQLDETRAQDSLGLQLSDITINNSAVSGWYVGILIYKSASQYVYAFSTNTIGNGATSVTFSNLNASYAGSAIVVPFLSSVRWNQGATAQSGIFLSCDVEPQSVTIHAPQVNYELSIYAQFGQAYGYVKYEVNIINNTGQAYTVNSLHIKLYDGSQNLYDENIGNVTVPARGSLQYKSSRAEWSITYDSTKNYKVVVTSNAQPINGEEVVNAPRI